MYKLIPLAFVFVAACGGCVQELPGPTVYLRFDTTYDLGPDVDGATSPWTDEQKTWVTASLRQWERVGFGSFYRLDQTEIDPSLIEIDPSVSSYTPSSLHGDEYIVITVHKDADLKLGPTEYAGLHEVETREVYLNARMWDAPYSYHDFDSVAIHEVGHLLLHSEHLPPGQVGVMGSPRTGDTLSPDDLRFACDVAERCDSY